MCQIIEGSNGETKLKTIDSNLKKDTKNDTNKKSFKKKNGLKKKKVSFFLKSIKITFLYIDGWVRLPRTL